MNVALAIVVDTSRRYTLTAQRPEGAHLGGKREFPGGKIEPGESAENCAIREAREETALDAKLVERWQPVTFAYPDVTVTLHPFLCCVGTAETPAAPWEWSAISDLDPSQFPEANVPLLARLRAIADPTDSETRA